MDDRSIATSGDERHFDERLGGREIHDNGRARGKITFPERAICLVHRATVRRRAYEDQHRHDPVERRARTCQRLLHLLENVPGLGWDVSTDAWSDPAHVYELSALDNFGHWWIVSGSGGWRAGDWLSSGRRIWDFRFPPNGGSLLISVLCG